MVRNRTIRFKIQKNFRSSLFVFVVQFSRSFLPSPIGASALLLYHFTSFLSTLFSNFFQVFRVFLFGFKPSLQATSLFYHTLPPLSTPFFNFFSYFSPSIFCIVFMKNDPPACAFLHTNKKHPRIRVLYLLSYYFLSSSTTLRTIAESLSILASISRTSLN